MKRILVIFDEQIRIDDLESCLSAIKGMKDVAGVTPHEMLHDIYVDEHKYLHQIFDILEPEK